MASSEIPVHHQRVTLHTPLAENHAYDSNVTESTSAGSFTAADARQQRLQLQSQCLQGGMNGLSKTWPERRRSFCSEGLSSPFGSLVKAKSCSSQWQSEDADKNRSVSAFPISIDPNGCTFRAGSRRLPVLRFKTAWIKPWETEADCDTQLNWRSSEKH